MVYDKALQAFMCLWLSSFPSTICWRDGSFPLFSLGNLVSDQLTIYANIYFWDVYFVQLFYVSALISILSCFEYYTTAIYSEVRNMTSLVLIFFLRIILSNWFIFRIFLIFFNAMGILIEIALNLYIIFSSEAWVLIKVSNHWIWNVFPLTFFNCFQQCFVVFSVQVFYFLNWFF